MTIWDMTMTKLTYDKVITALLVVDPYNDFISKGGKIWDRIKGVAEANNCVPNMLQVLNAARGAGLRVFYALHHRYRPGDYETWKYIAPIQKAGWMRKSFEFGTWGGEIRPGFEPNGIDRSPQQTHDEAVFRTEPLIARPPERPLTLKLTTPSGVETKFPMT